MSDQPVAAHAPLFVRLSSTEMAVSSVVAAKRQKNKEDAGTTNNRKSVTRNDTETHLIGIRAEIAVANYFGCSPDWTLCNGSDGGIDFVTGNGTTVQVKCRAPWIGRDFAMMSEDPNSFVADIGVLVYETRDPCLFELVATITRERFMETHKPVSFGRFGTKPGVSPRDMDPMYPTPPATV